VAETTFYWICKCKTANLKENNICKNCGYKRKKILLWTVAAIIIIILIIANLDYKENINVDIPNEQLDFNEVLRLAKTQIGESNNLVAARDYFENRDKDLLAILTPSADIHDWVGTVIAINNMRFKDAISIDIGNAEFIAGVSDNLGINTLIDKNSKLHEKIKLLKVGDSVVINGKIIAKNNSVVETNTFNLKDINQPKFLFDFNDITKK
jgi:hypothetical protein